MPATAGVAGALFTLASSPRLSKSPGALCILLYHVILKMSISVHKFLDFFFSSSFTFTPTSLAHLGPFGAALLTLVLSVCSHSHVLVGGPCPPHLSCSRLSWTNVHFGSFTCLQWFTFTPADHLRYGSPHMPSWRLRSADTFTPPFIQLGFHS